MMLLDTIPITADAPSDYQSISQWADADRDVVLVEGDDIRVVPARMRYDDVHALGLEVLARYRGRYERAWGLARRWHQRIPLAAKRGALAGWREPWAVSPEPDDGFPLDALVVLYGPVGGGKSSRAARWALRDPVGGVRWEDARNFDFRRHDDVRATCEWCLAHAGQLVIDDVGKCGEAEAAAIVDVCIGRAERRRGTLLTSNLGRDEMARVLGSRFVDRVDRFLDVGGSSKRTGPEAVRFAAEMDHVQRMAETRAIPYAAMYHAVRDAARDHELTMRQLYTLAALSRNATGDDVPWLNERVATLFATMEA